MKRVEKKVQPPYFQAILDGRKNYELRLADFTVNKGDILVLKEWDPNAQCYTGRELEREVTYTAVFSLADLGKFWSKEDLEKHGIQVISLK